MQDTVKTAIAKVRAYLGCEDAEEALSAIQMVLRLKPDTATNIALCNAKDEIRRKDIRAAYNTVSGILAREESRRTQKQSYSRPPTFAVLPVIYYTLRGTAKLKEGGSFSTTLNPGAVQHIIFMRQGSPVGIGVCRDVIHDDHNALWVVVYGEILWLKT